MTLIKQANPVSDQDFKSHLFQEETEKDPSPAKEKTKKKKVVKPTESKRAKPELGETK